MPADLPAIPAELLEQFGDGPMAAEGDQCRDAGAQEGPDRTGAGR